jgi:hypothetical protein
VAPTTVLDYKPRPAKLAQVLRNCGTRYGERSGDLAGRLSSLPQQVEDGAPGGIGKGMEGSLGRICNRSVPHNA